MGQIILLTVSQFSAALGSVLTYFAVNCWLYSKTGRATDLSFLSFLVLLPSIFTTMATGSIIDRFNVKTVLVYANAFSAAIFLLLIGLLFFSQPTVLSIVLVTALAMSASPLQSLAVTATVPRLVKKESLARGVATLAIGAASARLAAPLFSSFLGGEHQLILAASVSSIFALIAAVTARLVRVPQHTGLDRVESRSLGFLKGFHEGLAYVWDMKPLAFLLGFGTCLSFLLGAASVLVAPMILAKTGQKQEVLALSMSFGAIGGLVGSFVAIVFRFSACRQTRIIAASSVLSGLAVMSMGLSSIPSIWIMAEFVIMASIAFSTAPNLALWQSKIDLAIQGRVLAARNFILDLSIPIAALCVGPLADHFFDPFVASHPMWLEGFSGQGSGISFFMTIVGIGTVLLSVGVLLSQRFRNLDSLLPDAIR